MPTFAPCFGGKLMIIDPAAETAKYLATLPPEVHAKATAYTQGGHWLLLWGTLAAIVVAWLIVRSGVLVKIRSGVERRRTRPWLAVLAVVPVALLMESILGLPWAAYSNWWREKSYGMTSQPFGGWLGEQAMGAVIGLIAMTVLMLLVYWLMRRARKTWWLWAGGVTAGFMIVAMLLAPTYILPLFNTYTPAPQGPVRDAVVELARANGVPSDKIFVFNGSKQSNRYTANVTGLFGSAQINISDTMLKAGADMSEIRAVVGHEIGHYALGHIFRSVGVMAVLCVIGFWLMDRLFPLACRLLGAHDVKGISDPAGYPVFSMLLAILFLLATPVTNTVTRMGEAEADNYSLRVANEPDGLAKALVQTVEYRAATPGKLEEVIFYSHPSVSWRVRNAMEWKARRQPSTPR
ncbi:MAG: M48 family metallopeptidase [Caulobacter sp.]|nr:M48 family metallopeptidase [Caulobacter sp.]